MRASYRFMTVAACAALVGCGALIGVRDDLVFDVNAGDAGADADATAVDGQSSDGGHDANVESDAGEGGSCTPSPDFQSDPHNCGRCGHDCLNGACESGVCKAFQIATVQNGPLDHLRLWKPATGPAYLIMTSLTCCSDQTAGILRVKTTGGSIETIRDGSLDDFHYAREIEVIGDTLYFATDDDKYDDAGALGGVWSCDLKGPLPCSPTLVRATDAPALVLDNKGRVVFSDDNGPITAFTPPSTFEPVSTSEGYGFSHSAGRGVYDGVVYYQVSSSVPSYDPSVARVFEVLPGQAGTQIATYSAPSDHDAWSARLYIGSDFLIQAAYDSEAAGGILHRQPRGPNSEIVPCDYGGVNNKRPYGIYVADNYVYWTNMGSGPRDNGEPRANYPDSQVMRCPLTGCCAAGEELWTGAGTASEIIGDDEALYWVTYGNGGVWKMAKP